MYSIGSLHPIAQQQPACRADIDMHDSQMEIEQDDTRWEGGHHDGRCGLRLGHTVAGS